LRFDASIDGIGGTTGGADGALSALFSRPATFNEDTDFYASFEIESRNEEDFEADILSLEAGIRRYASDRREYTFGLGIQSARTVDDFGEQDYTILTAPASALFDYRDDKLNATDGYYAEVKLTPFFSLEGTDDGLLSTADLRAYKSVGPERGVTFAFRGQFGSLVGPGLLNAPADFLFYSGGGGTVRGHEYQSLSIDLGGGNETGGRSFLGFSGEARVKTTDALSLVAFYDAGYIGREEFPDGSSGEWHSGAGIGVRYDTGIGPIRLDLAVPLDGPGDPSGFEIYIGIGQAF
jgi:translocation and assembly module TamA